MTECHITYMVDHSKFYNVTISSENGIRRSTFSRARTSPRTFPWTPPISWPPETTSPRSTSHDTRYTRKLSRPLSKQSKVRISIKKLEAEDRS